MNGNDLVNKRLFAPESELLHNAGLVVGITLVDENVEEILMPSKVHY